MAALAIAVAGSAIGSAIGGTVLGMSAAQIGWMVGSTVGSLLFAEGQDVQQQGPRLGDLKVMTSTAGAPMAKTYGTTRVAGNVIWSEAILETVSTSSQSGGKGGGGGSVTTTTYSYSAWRWPCAKAK